MYANRGGLDASVTLVRILSTDQYFILIKPSVRRHVVIVSIDRVSGALQHTGTYGKDVFLIEAQALDHLKTGGPLEVVATGKHVLGYVVIGPMGLLLLAEKTRVSATLPGNHQIKTLVTTRWHKIPLQLWLQLQASAAGTLPPQDVPPEAYFTQAQREEHARGVDKVTTFPLDGAHYFCDTMDVSRPFPSERPPMQPSWEFVWNHWLTASFRSVRLGHVCPLLLQGLCEERQLNDFDGSRYHIAHVSRRGRLHVGPRYKARGLNDCAEPGNEIECELLVWRPNPKEGAPVPWSRYAWRRGSVPLWWGVQMRGSGLGEAEIKIKETNTFKGTRRYVRRLQKRFTPNPRLDPLSPAASPEGPSVPPTPQADPEASASLPVLFVSLLRKGTPERDRSEAKLASAFDFVIGALRKEHHTPISYIALDWHEMDKQLGHEGIVEAFWQTVRNILPAHGFALGTMTKVGKDDWDYQAEDVDPPPSASGWGVQGPCLSGCGIGWQVKWLQQQRGLARYNCADSLDRTNVGSFFGAVQVFVEQCRCLDIAIAVSPRNTSSLGAAMARQQQQQQQQQQQGSSIASGDASRFHGSGSAQKEQEDAGISDLLGLETPEPPQGSSTCSKDPLGGLDLI
mmetsp:Transcript_29308/g.75960  ORF Transcript_29308/g.75960 Transcript_29308/m.75960 type:complete len:625 (+) Transcript_29308:102-1976(+)